MLSRVKIENFLGVAFADLELKQANLIVGGNGSGKSSIQNALRLMLEGRIDRVAMKKEYGALVREGAKAAGITLTLENGTDALAVIKRSGQATGLPAASGPYIALQPSLFASLTADERAQRLSDLTGVKWDGSWAKAELIKRGAREDLVGHLAAELVVGAAPAHEKASDRMKECRGAWRAITGQVYGPEKAKEWQPTLPPKPPGDVATLRAQAAALDDVTAERALQLRAERAKPEASDAQSLSPKEVADAARDLEASRAALAVLNERVTITRAKWSEAKDRKALTCPHCSGAVMIANGALVAGSDPSAAQEEAAELEAAWRKWVADRDNMQGKVKNAERLIAQSQQAHAEARDPERIASLVAEIEAKTREKDGYWSAVRAIEEWERASAQAQAQAEKALQAHEEAVAWAHIADMLSPTGLPAELAAKALTTVNQQLADLSGTASFPQIVQIGQDMGVTYGGRDYRLLSESEKWRCDAVIGLMFAGKEGMPLLLDRFDVLEVSARGGILQLALSGIMPGVQVLVFGTLKNKPAIAAMGVWWMDQGRAT